MTLIFNIIDCNIICISFEFQAEFIVKFIFCSGYNINWYSFINVQLKVETISMLSYFVFFQLLKTIFIFLAIISCKKPTHGRTSPSFTVSQQARHFKIHWVHHEVTEEGLRCQWQNEEDGGESVYSGSPLLRVQKPANSSCVQASGGPQRHRRTAKRRADTNSPRVT